MDPTYYAWLAGFVLLIAGSLLTKGDKKPIVINVLLVFSTIFVFQNVYKGFIKRANSNTAATKADKAELLLKFSSGYVALEAYTKNIPGSKDVKEAGKEKLYAEADEMLVASMEAAPKSSKILLRKIVLDGEQGKNVKKLVKKMRALGTDKTEKLANLYEALYVKRHVGKGQFKELKKIVEEDVPVGWYKEISNLQLFKVAKHKKEFKKLHADFHEHYLHYMGRLCLFGIVAFCCFLIGIIIIFCQLFFLSRSPTSAEEKALVEAPSSWSWKVVVGVFLGWLSVEFLSAPPIKMVAANLANYASSGGIQQVALLTAGLYLFQNLPALILIWFIGVRPNKLNFFHAVKLKFKVLNRGPIKLFFHGIGAWYAAIPLVALAVFVSTKFGSQGSDNPIVAVVMAAAKEADFFGVILFIIALGVLPAFCEEILFRGFLYTSLRRKMGAFFAMFISAFVFSAIHLDPGGALQLFVLGFLFAFVFEKTKSIFPSMVAHCMWNSCTFLMALVAYS